MISQTELAEVFGGNQVSFEGGTLDAYARDMSFMPPVRPGCVVQPRDGHQVARLVELANRSGTPLVPVSSGPPHFKGDTVPEAGGAIVVDLSAMKRVLHIDRKNRVAMFEPGVTFGELSESVAAQGLRLNMPLLPRATKSVAGSLLEREPVLMPKYHWDIADPLACTEIVFGSGELFRTGAAAGSGSIEEQWAAGGAQKEAAGPSAASWYRIIQGAQGTMGIVTWVSARLELAPTRQAPFFVAGDRLDKILDAVHWLIRLRLVNECFVLNHVNMAVLMDRDGAAVERRVPAWVLFFNVAAYEFLPDERLAGQIADMAEVIQRSGIEAATDCGGLSADNFLKMVQKPSAEPYWKLRPKGGCEDVFFLTTLDKVPAMVDVMQAVADDRGHARQDLGIYIQPIVQGVNCHCEFSLFYDPRNRPVAERTRSLTGAAVRHLAASGAFFSRPYGEHARFLVNRDGESAALLKKLKQIVDPRWIMNPGKLCF